MSQTFRTPPLLYQHPVRRIGRYLPLILWMAFISLASTDEFSAMNTSRVIGPIFLWLFPHASSETLAAVHFAIRKAAHFVEYAVLGFLCARAFRTSSHMFLQSHWLAIALLLISTYALLDEYHQSFIPSRTASVYDSLIDTAGGATALLLLRRRKVRQN